LQATKSSKLQLIIALYIRRLHLVDSIYSGIIYIATRSFYDEID